VITKVDTNYLENYKKEFIYTCKKCKGADYYCECWNQYRFEFKKIKARIPIKFRSFDLSQITHPQIQIAKAKIEEYIKTALINPRAARSLYLHGTGGTAKSVLGNIILMEVIKKNYKGMYFDSFLNCSNYIVDGWYEKNKEVSIDIFDVISSYDFVVIDEIGDGCGTSNPSIENTLKKIFRERSNNLLPTIFISSHNKRDVKDPLEAHIISLFSESMSSIEFKGFDYRKHVINKVKDD